MNRKLGAVTLFGLMALSTGCGLAINGIHQDVPITSSPGGSRVTVDGVPRGTTPVVVSLSRKHAHAVSVERDGSTPAEAGIVPETSMWEWGNVIFGGLVGLGIDAWTGGMYELTPNKVHADFPDQPAKPATTMLTQ